MLEFYIRYEEKLIAILIFEKTHQKYKNDDI